ncbi:MAG: Crp/Fnr family transcriptional regulator [Pseudomonadota bacterium]
MRDGLETTPIDPSHSAAVRRLGAGRVLSNEEIAFFEAAQNDRAEYAAGDDIVRDDDLLRHAVIIRKGWAMRWHATAGGTRQIINVYVPGEIYGLHINFYRHAMHNLTALTEVELARIGPEQILDIYRTYPILAAGLDWSSARSVNVLSERNISLGARRASSRILHLLLEIYLRLMAVGETEADGFAMPLTQQQLADICGLSIVHTNRTLRALVRAKLIALSRARVTFPDFDAAMAACEFDGRFLAPLKLRMRPG